MIVFFAHFLNIMYTGTFGLFSLAMLIALSSSYCMERNMTVDKTVLYVLVSIGAFGAQFYSIDGTYNIDMLDVRGCFFSLVTAILSCVLLEKLQKFSILNFREQTNGGENYGTGYKYAVSSGHCYIDICVCDTKPAYSV